MSVISDLHARLAADATLRALVDTDLSTNAQVYVGQPSKDASLNYVTISSVGEEEIGDLIAVTGLINKTVQITCISRSKDGGNAALADAMRDAVRDSLNGLQGATMGSTEVRSMRFSGVSDQDQSPTDGGEGPTFRRQIEVSIWYVDSVPTPV